MGIKNSGTNIAGLETDLAALQITASAIKAKTDNLPADPADESNQTALHTVPGQNVGTNVNMRDVIGNKTDTVAGDSLVSEIKKAAAAIGTIDGYQDVPIKNSGDNSLVRDVIGQKTDDEDGTSIYSKLYVLSDHAHSISYVYPERANSVQLIKDAGAWANYPAVKTEIIPAGTIVSPFDIHQVVVDTISANGRYVVRLYQGSAGNEVLIGMIATVRNNATSREGQIYCQTPLIAANSRISAALTSENVAQDSLNIKLYYHVY